MLESLHNEYPIPPTTQEEVVVALESALQLIRKFRPVIDMAEEEAAQYYEIYATLLTATGRLRTWEGE